LHQLTDEEFASLHQQIDDVTYTFTFDFK
jgi:hypothetical protein